jgi:hypothetical protein
VPFCRCADDPSMKAAPLLQGGVAYGAVYSHLEERTESDEITSLPTFVQGEQPSCAPTFLWRRSDRNKMN